MGAIIEVSTVSDDPDLSWAQVWSWDSRVWFASLAMCCIGTLEWFYLHHLSNSRPPPTQLREDEYPAKQRLSSTLNFGVSEERKRSRVDDNGINARDLVKLFRINPSKETRQDAQTSLKAAVKGVSFGIKRGEIVAVLGPNGAGKSVTMGMLTGTYTPEHGEVALAGQRLTSEHRSDKHLFEKDIAFCPQCDALFPSKTVRDHFRFYAKARGLDTSEEATVRHLDAIENLLGLSDHMDKFSTDISGGYKRRTCLGIAMIGNPEVMILDECTTGM
jgi:ABC-type glutathione transport system ATPase component